MEEEGGGEEEGRGGGTRRSLSGGTIEETMRFRRSLASPLLAGAGGGLPRSWAVLLRRGVKRQPEGSPVDQQPGRPGLPRASEGFVVRSSTDASPTGHAHCRCCAARHRRRIAPAHRFCRRDAAAASAAGLPRRAVLA